MQRFGDQMSFPGFPDAAAFSFKRGEPLEIVDEENVLKAPSPSLEGSSGEQVAIVEWTEDLARQERGFSYYRVESHLDILDDLAKGLQRAIAAVRLELAALQQKDQ